VLPSHAAAANDAVTNDLVHDALETKKGSPETAETRQRTQEKKTKP
jgi:hypothetical protein